MESLNDAYSIVQVYVSPIICLAGFFLSLFSFIVFLKLSKGRIFFYLMVKSLLEMLLFAFGTLTPYLSCLFCSTANTKHSQWIKLILYVYLKPVLFLFITILEIVISINRYFSIKNTEKIDTNKNDKIFVISSAIIVSLIFSVFFFGYKIELVTINNLKLFVIATTDFGSKTFFSVYSLFVNFISNLLTIFVLIPLNIILFIQFKKFIERKKRLLNQTDRIINDTRFTKMILITSFLFIFSRLFEAFIDIVSIYYYLSKNKDYIFYYFLILNLFVLVNTYFIISLNFIIFYYSNKPYRDTFKQIFCRRKVTNSFRNHRIQH